jgi:hypothetical protein
MKKDYVNKLVTQKEMKKTWECIRNISRRREPPVISVKPHE